MKSQGVSNTNTRIIDEDEDEDDSIQVGWTIEYDMFKYLSHRIVLNGGGNWWLNMTTGVSCARFPENVMLAR